MQQAHGRGVCIDWLLHALTAVTSGYQCTDFHGGWPNAWEISDFHKDCVKWYKSLTTNPHIFERILHRPYRVTLWYVVVPGSVLPLQLKLAPAPLFSGFGWNHGSTKSAGFRTSCLCRRWVGIFDTWSSRRNVGACI